MNPFISIPENGFDRYSLIYCAPNTVLITEYIPNSSVFYIVEDQDSFFTQIKSVEMDEQDNILLYDIGDNKSASIVF